jgi:hypothetical protein
MKMAKAKSTSSTLGWAESEFGGAALGDKRRVDRLVAIAAAGAESPGGTVTRVVASPAEREGAYRFLENDEIPAAEIVRASTRACLSRTVGMPFVFVPVDGSSLTLTDRPGARGMGLVAERKVTSRGLEVMSAIGISPEGTPVGLCGQRYWVRPKVSSRIPSPLRPIEEKETRYWLEVMDALERERASVPGSAVPWYQLDRGADFRERLEWTLRADSFVTVRAASNRRLADKRARLLWDELAVAPLLGHYSLELQPHRKRKPRAAKLSVRAKTVTLRLTEHRTGRRSRVSLQAAFVREVGTTPRTEKPIEWLLLTNHSVKDFEEARLVIRGYSARWRVEEFHRTWKTICGIEDAQLRSVAAMECGATTLAAVAMRIQRTPLGDPRGVEESLNGQASAGLRSSSGVLRGAGPSDGEPGVPLGPARPRARAAWPTPKNCTHRLRLRGRFVGSWPARPAAPDQLQRAARPTGPAASGCAAAA